MSDDLKTGDKVIFRAFGNMWFEGVVDHLYETSNDVVIKVDYGDTKATYERKREDVRKVG